MWQILDTGVNTSFENMKMDESLLLDLQVDDDPILHFYDWKNLSFTYGYFLSPSSVIDVEKAKNLNLCFAKRPTGGGMVFHIWDLAFSALVPKNHEGYSENTLFNYDYINSKVLKAFSSIIQSHQMPHLLQQEPTPKDKSCMSFCYAKPTKYDVMLGPYKVAGSAQRRKQNGYLHQGSISLACPRYDILEKILLPDTEVLKAMRANSYFILQENWKQSELDDLRNEMKNALKLAFLG